MRVEKGEFVAVLGHNGSGKSTLAKLINAAVFAAFRPRRGGGAGYGGEGQRLEVRRHCGMVFQNPDNQLVATVVEEDVAFGLETSACPARRFAGAWTRRWRWWA